MTDIVFIRDLHLRCVIGANDWEREVRQDVLVNVELHTDTRPAAASDDLSDAVDYKTLGKKIIALVESSSFFLVETMAEEIAAICLDDPRVQSTLVRVEKPGALRFAESVGVEIGRARGA